MGKKNLLYGYSSNSLFNVACNVKQGITPPISLCLPATLFYPHLLRVFRRAHVCAIH